MKNCGAKKAETLFFFLMCVLFVCVCVCVCVCKKGACCMIYVKFKTRQN